jgi:hypothetical protein
VLYGRGNFVVFQIQNCKLRVSSSQLETKSSYFNLLVFVKPLISESILFFWQAQDLGL